MLVFGLAMRFFKFLFVLNCSESDLFAKVIAPRIAPQTKYKKNRALQSLQGSVKRHIHGITIHNYLLEQANFNTIKTFQFL